MMNIGRIELKFSGSSEKCSFDSVTETFGSVISKTPAYEGVYSVISGVRERSFILKGKLTREQLSAYEGMKAYTGMKKTITLGGSSYSNMTLESVKAEFEGSALTGNITAVLTEVS